MDKLLSALSSIFDSTGRAFLLTLALAAIVYLPLLGNRPLSGSDETRVAGISAGMERAGDWVVPRLNGDPFLELPPLYWWSSAGLFRVFGESTAVAKLPSALSALAGVLIAFWLARSFGLSNLTAFVCSMILATSPEYWVIGRRCIMDMLLCACIAFSILAFVKFADWTGGGRGRWLWLALFWLGLSGAVMTKGVVGLGIPCSGLFVWLLVRRERSLLIWAGLFSSALLSLLPCLLWLAALWQAEGPSAVKTLAWTNNLGRFTGGHAEHVEPFHYYFRQFPAQFMPWTILAAASAFLLFKGLLKEGSRKAAVFGALAVAVPFAILCVAAGKRAIYLVPLYPAAALFAAVSAEWLFERLKGRERLLRASLTGVFAVYALSMLAADAFIIPAVNKEKSYEPLFKKCGALVAEGGSLVLLNPLERISGGAVFYLGGRFKTCRTVEELAAETERNPKVFSIAAEDDLGRIKGAQLIERFPAGKRGAYVVFSLKKTDGP